MHTVYADISSCIRHAAARVDLGRWTVAMRNGTLVDNGIGVAIPLSHPAWREDLSIYIIFNLPYSLIRAIYIVSGATSGDRFLAGCKHLDYERFPKFHSDASIAEHTTFAWYASIVPTLTPLSAF